MILTNKNLEFLSDTRKEIRNCDVWQAQLCICDIDNVNQYVNVERHLHKEEYKKYKGYKTKEAMQNYITGRHAAKQAVASFNNNEYIDQIHISNGVFNQPVIHNSTTSNIQISITHSNNIAASIAFPEEFPMGIDIEKAETEKIDTLDTQMKSQEVELLKQTFLSEEKGLTMLWSAKESLSKVLKTGLMTSFLLLEINKIQVSKNGFICFFKNFPQYQAISFELNEYILSVVHPIGFHTNKSHLSNILKKVKIKN